MASELKLEQKTWHQLECAANSAGGIEVAMVSLPIEQVKALVEGRNTRPAPVDANPLASNPVDDKIAPDTDGKRDSASDREGA